MSTLVVAHGSTLAQAHTALGDLIANVESLRDPEELREARARTEAVKAWAKAHGKLAEIRLDLLRVEVALLVRIAEVGALRVLSDRDAKAVRWLAALSAQEREHLLKTVGKTTTAAGMCQAVWTAEENARAHRANFEIGQARAEEPCAPDMETATAEAWHAVVGVNAALAKVLDDYLTEGVAFSVDDLADEVMQSAGNHHYAQDEGIAEGVREVCRRAIRRAPTVKLDGTVLPRLVTTRTDDGQYIRIPVENALMANLDDMLVLRREQVAADQAALAALEAVANRLREVPGCTRESRIGDLIARSVVTTQRRDAA